MGLLGGPVFRNLPCNAVDIGSAPGLGRSHAVEQLRLWATTTEASVTRAYALLQEKPLQGGTERNEKPVHWNEGVIPICRN